MLVREDGITTYAGSTARAWAILEREVVQKIAAGAQVELVFDRLQGNLRGGASIQRNIPARTVSGSDVLEFLETPSALGVGMPISDATGKYVPDGSVVLATNGRQIQISTPAASTGDVTLLVGGLRVPYTQLYEIDATVTVEGVTAGSTIRSRLDRQWPDNPQVNPHRGAFLRVKASRYGRCFPWMLGFALVLSIGHNGKGEISTIAGSTRRRV